MASQLGSIHLTITRPLIYNILQPTHFQHATSLPESPESPIGSFRLSPSSVGHPCLLVPRWNTSTSTREDIYMPSRWQIDIENSQWLEVLHLFTAAKNLYPSKEFSPRIAPALKELVGGRTTRSVTHLAESFLRGPAIRTCTRSHWRLRRTTTPRTPYSCFFLGKIIVGHVVAMGGYLLIGCLSVLLY
jgi:hypothetical protein